MNVVVVVNEQPDFLQDTVFHGLVSILGAERVLDLSPVGRYRLQPPPDAPFPMLYLGLPPRPVVSEDEAIADADAFVIGSLRPGALALARRVVREARGRPVAFLDGEDDPYVRGIVRDVDVYFKRETLRADPMRVAAMPLRRLRDRARSTTRLEDPLKRRTFVATGRSRRVVPLPFGIIDSGFVSNADRSIDVAFLGSATSVQRRALARQLDVLEAEGICTHVALVEDGHRVPWQTYMDVLSRTRIAISVRGLGFDTYRYWEIPYAGALLLAETPQIVIPRNFEQGSEAIFADVGELAATARTLLAGNTTEIAARGRERLLRDHTSVQRAQTVIERLEMTRAR